MIERSRVRIPAGTAGEFSSPGSTFCADSYFGIRSTETVTTVARKKSRSFCQKCRWQVTAKHAYTLRIEPCFGIGHNLSLICQMTSEDIKHQLIIMVELELATDHVTEWQLPDTAGDVVPLIPGEIDDWTDRLRSRHRAWPWTYMIHTIPE